MKSFPVQQTQINDIINKPIIMNYIKDLIHLHSHN